MYENFEENFEQAVKKWNADPNNHTLIIETDLQNLYDLNKISELLKKIEQHNTDKKHEDLFKILKQIEKVEVLKNELKELIQNHKQNFINDKKFYQDHFTLMAKLYLLPQHCSTITHEYTNCVSDGFGAYDIDGLIKWLKDKNTMPTTQEPPSPELLSFIKLLRPDCKLQADEDEDNIKVYSEYKNAIFERWPEIAKKYKNFKLDGKDDNKHYFETLCALLWQIMLFLITKKDFETHKVEFEEKLEFMTNKKEKQHDKERNFLDYFIKRQLSEDSQELKYLMTE